MIAFYLKFECVIVVVMTDYDADGKQVGAWSLNITAN